MEKTIQQAAKDALQVQDACNLSGVVRAFATITDLLWTEARKQNQGTEWVNTHPISVMFASKIASLTRCDDAFSRAYDNCEKLANGEVL